MTKYSFGMKTFLVSTALVTAVACSTVNAQTEDKVSEMPVYSSLTLSGIVKNIDEANDEFMLDYGTGSIQVATDEYYDKHFYEPSAEEFLVEGELATVSGYIDKDTFEQREIDAHTIVKQNGTTLYTTLTTPVAYYNYYEPVEGRATLSGTVKDIKSTEEFILDYGTGQLEVDLSDLPVNPLEVGAINPLVEGEKVVVSGWLDDDLFDNYDLDAYRLTQLEWTN